MAKKSEPILYFEEVKERFAGEIIASTCRPATKAEIDECKRLHAKGKCPHTIVIDEKAYMYDYRLCGVCGAGLGAI
jgi:hypothetical protein